MDEERWEKEERRSAKKKWANKLEGLGLPSSSTLSNVGNKFGNQARQARAAISSLPANLPSSFSSAAASLTSNIPPSMIPSMVAERYDESKRLNMQELMRINARVKRDAATRIKAHAFQMVNTSSAERKAIRKMLGEWVDQATDSSIKHARDALRSLLIRFCKFIVRSEGTGSFRMVIVEPLVSLQKIDAALDSLPPNVEFEGNLRASDCSLKSLPDDFRVHGSLILSGCATLESLSPRAIAVGGDLDLSGCSALKSLSERVHVGGNLTLSNCVSLTALPQELSCGGDVNLDGCTSIALIPAGWKIGGSLLARRCAALSAIGQWQYLGYGLNCYGCKQLSVLPGTVELKGPLELKACSLLELLPEHVVVGTYLNLTDCTSLKKLPESPSFYVEGDVYLEGCTSLFTLGARLLSWPLRQNGSPHNVYLGGSSIPESELEWLRDEELENVRLHVTRARQETTSGMQHNIEFDNLHDAVEFWVHRAELPDEKIGTIDLEAVVDKGSERGILQFLSKLLAAKDFQQEETQKDLARRVIEVLETVCANDFARNELISRMIDSVDTCSDKPIWALNQMNIIIKAVQARGDREKLRRLGLGVMRLDVVHRHVEKKIKSLKFVDDVCVYLRFEIALREELDLPCSALDMNFPTYISVSKAEIAKAKKEALAISQDAFNRWLIAWPEWQRQLRFEHAQANLLDWSALPSSQRRASNTMTDMIGNPVEDPVVLCSSVWSLHDLRRHWVETGMDLNGTMIDIETMKSIQRCKRK